MVENSGYTGKPQIVGAEEVADFGEGKGPEPDSLESVVAAAQPAEGKRVLPTEPLQKIAEAVRDHLTTLGRNPVEFPLYMDKFMPLVLSLRTCSGAPQNVIYSLSNIQTGYLLTGMREAFGDFFFETDIARGLGMDPNKPEQVIKLETLAAFLPELRALQNFADNLIPYTMIANPFLTLLRIPPEQRAFLAGAMEIAEQRGAFNTKYNSKFSAIDLMREVQKQVTLKDILQYGQQVGEKSLQQYLDALSQLDK